MERLLFKHTSRNVYLVADAYNGKYIRQCTIDFFKQCAGRNKDTLRVGEHIIGIGGNSSLLAYIGHDGLMDFSLGEEYIPADYRKRDAIMLACISKKYFAKQLAATGARPVLWTTGLMAPEAYTLHDALAEYIAGKPNVAIVHAAAKAYAQHQHCSLKAASGLLKGGW